MSLLVTSSLVIAAAAGVAYIGRKGWYAFHKAVGITPGTMYYTPPSQAPLPVLIELEIDKTVLAHLPSSALELLTRIDHKADIYQQWLDDLAQQGRQLPSSEEQFIVRKILSERLPDMLKDYQTLAQHQQRLSKLQQTTEQQNMAAALALLIELLDSTEKRLDQLLAQCQDSHYQELKVMRRYLDKR
ncbi:MAG: hypothetical protein Q4P13_00680 [Psychrobacter sp.]|nr:hypothetical protein [Psychrobacter sp.]